MISFDQKNFQLSVMMARRIHKNLDLRTAADQIGISSATLSRIENGKMVDMVTFVKICNWLNVPAEQYLNTPS